MFIKKKKNLQYKNELEKYNAAITYNAATAHKEMVIKSGSGLNNLLSDLNNLLELLDTQKYNIELLTQNIARLKIEICNMEKQITDLSICYKFKNSFIYIEINKIFFKQKIKKIFKIKFYILNIIQFIKFKNIIILLNLIFFLQHLKLF